MIENSMPYPANEAERIASLSEFDIDYSNMENNFKDLARLAAKIANVEISMINLIDTFNQWTISNHGLNVMHTPREETVCQYTIAQDGYYEIPDLAKDDRFKEKLYVNGPPHLRYYFGIPLTTSDGFNIGALCVLDKNLRTLSQEKMELLKIVADEVINRLQALKAIDSLKNRLNTAAEIRKKVAHDIRGPIAGIIGLSEIIEQQGANNDILECAGLIHKSGRSVLDLAEEILNEDMLQPLKEEEFNLIIFKDKIESLYLPQAKSKDITFKVHFSEKTGHVPFLKKKLLQITGNLISNALKFTPNNGYVIVDLDLLALPDNNIIKIKVTDSGIGLDPATISKIMQGNNKSTDGTEGEKGYGLGLSLVRQLVESINGKIEIKSIKDEGATFEVTLKQASQS